MNNLSMRLILIILNFVFMSGCVSLNRNQDSLFVVADDYFSVYSQRTDFKRLMSFYENNAKFEDIIFGNNLKNKEEIKRFLAWDIGEYKVLSGDRVLTVTKQTIDKKTVVTQGFFHKFSYNGETLGPWLFVIVQEFNSQNKIIKQTDWINYTPRKNFLGGENMNNVLIN